MWCYLEMGPLGGRGLEEVVRVGPCDKISALIRDTRELTSLSAM